MYDYIHIDGGRYIGLVQRYNLHAAFSLQIYITGETFHMFINLGNYKSLQSSAPCITSISRAAIKIPFSVLSGPRVKSLESLHLKNATPVSMGKEGGDIIIIPGSLYLVPYITHLEMNGFIGIYTTPCRCGGGVLPMATNHMAQSSIKMGSCTFKKYK